MAGHRRITLVGPIAEPGKPAIGGYESANLRLAQVLAKICPEVRQLPYPRTSGSRFHKGLQYASGFARLFFGVVRGGRGVVVHFTPLCRHFLAAELLLAFAARMSGSGLIVDLRAGMQESWYRKSSFLYRRAFRRLLSLATMITFEGEAYRDWLASLAPDRPRQFLPNFVPSAMLNPRPRGALPPSPKLIYVGAITADKGVERALRIFQQLRRRYPASSFMLVGRCEAGYRQALERMDLLGEGVELTGPLPESSVLERLDESHFFLFLSQWFGEGHSNALNESMARGCVPIVVSHGFSEAVVACPELVVSNEDEKAISSLIETIWQSGRWQALSDYAVQRISANFTDRQALATLSAIYSGG